MSDWAEKKLANLPMGVGMQSVHAEAALRAIKAEYQRAVRIVKRMQRDAKRVGFGLAYGVALKDVLAALQRGRTRGK